MYSSPLSSAESRDHAAVRRLVVERTGRNWCLFLDRDGVINRQIVGDYVRRWSDFDWLPSAVRGLRVLRQWAPHLVVVTNQQGVGKGLMNTDDLESIHENLRVELAKHGVAIDSVRACPHLESALCACRKPRPGMVLEWLEEHPEIDHSLSIVVGDSRSDIELACQVAQTTGKCASIRIDVRTDSRQGADARFSSLWDFANIVENVRTEIGREA